MPAGLRFFAAVLMAVLGGCGWLGQARQLPEIPLLPPAEFSPTLAGEPVQFTERVTIIRSGREQVMLAAWAVNRNQLNLVGLTPAGQRLLTLSYDGQTFTEDYSALVTEPIPGREVLSHLQLAHWPPGSIEQALATTPWHFVAQNNERRLYLNEQLIIIIRRDPPRISVESPVMDYALHVRELADEVDEPQ